jgi:hypothetical protein
MAGTPVAAEVHKALSRAVGAHKAMRDSAAKEAKDLREQRERLHRKEREGK